VTSASQPLEAAPQLPAAAAAAAVDNADDLSDSGSSFGADRSYVSNYDAASTAATPRLSANPLFLLDNPSGGIPGGGGGLNKDDDEEDFTYMEGTTGYCRGF
jgi:hypothetical protein